MNKLINNFKNINFNNLSKYQYLLKNFNSYEWNKYIVFDEDNYRVMRGDSQNESMD